MSISHFSINSSLHPTTPSVHRSCINIHIIQSSRDSVFQRLHPDFASFTEDNIFPSYSLVLAIRCGGIDWQVSFMAQICSPPLSLLSRIEQLDIQEQIDLLESALQVGMDNIEWLDFFHPFTIVQTLNISGEFRSSIARTQRGIDHGVTCFGRSLPRGILSIWTGAERRRAIRNCTAALWSPYHCPPPGKVSSCRHTAHLDGLQRHRATGTHVPSPPHHLFQVTPRT
jgi:hypothetical protein